MNYRPLYTLKIEHDYFDRGVCRAVRCGISRMEPALWHRRGLLLKQTGDNEWTILYDSDGAGVDVSDVLVLDLDFTDPLFVLYTKWDGFQPDAAYRLELPQKKETIDAVDCVRKISPKRIIGIGLFQISIRMTDKLVKMAKEGRQPGCTLQFHSRAYRWEYLLVPRCGSNLFKEKYMMEEMDGKLHFRPLEKVNIYGSDMLHTVSEEFVTMHERYDYRLKVVASSDGTRRNRTVISHIAYPVPGMFMDVETGLIRQVCHL